MIDDEIYMSIAFLSISREKAGEIVKVAMGMAGNVDVSVHYSSPIETEDEETQDDYTQGTTP